MSNKKILNTTEPFLKSTAFLHIGDVFIDIRNKMKT